MASQPKSLHIFGVTGSIGQSAGKVISAQPERFTVRTVTAGRNAEKLAESAIALKAGKAVIADEGRYMDLKSLLSGTGIECAAGEGAVAEAAREEVDLSLMAIVGIAGLRPLWAALDSSRAVAIANKEPLVAAGPLVMDKARANKVTILPVDSEHNAIFQVFENHNRTRIERLILTASGGPFRTWSLKEMACATPEQALKHPNWTMGAKITVDSATMMNKALEVIEARYLFDMPPERIEVLVHPQSTVHSMVEYADGSVLAQMGASDMCTPIAHALSWPERIATPGSKLDFVALRELTFEKPDFSRFPALGLAYKSLRGGLSCCIVLNAANEILVEAFLQKRIGFLDIAKLTDYFLNKSDYAEPRTLEEVEFIDRDVRGRVEGYLKPRMNVNGRE